VILGYEWDVPIDVYPIAYDQFDNAKFVENNKGKKIDISSSLSVYRKNVLKLFDIDVGMEIIVPSLPRLDEVVCAIERGATTKTMSVHRVTTVMVESDVMNVSKDCVIKSILIGTSKEQHERCKTIYDAWLKCGMLTQLSDVVVLVQAMEIEMCVKYMEVGYLFTTAGFSTDKEYPCIVIDDKLQHCTPQIVKVNGTNQVLTQVPWLDVFPLGTMMDKAHLLLQLASLLHKIEVKQLDTRLNDCADVINRSHNFSLSSLTKTAMRKRDLATLTDLRISTGGCSAGQKNEKLSHGYVYRVFAEDMSYLAICMQDVISGTLCLFHGSTQLRRAYILYRLNKVQTFPNPTRMVHYLPKTVVCINQSTAKYCENNGHLFASIGATSAETLLVHNTWNRLHHLEKEQECIDTAKSVLLVGETNNKKNIKNLLMMRDCSRIIVLAGKLYWCFEVNSDESERSELTRTILSNLQGFNLVQGTNVYIKEFLNKHELEDVNECFELVDGMYASWRSDPMQLDENKEYSIDELGNMYDMFLAQPYLHEEHSRLSTRFKISTEELRYANKMQTVTLKQLRLLSSCPCVFTEEGVIFNKGFSSFKVVVKGSGQYINESSQWHSTELEMRGKDEDANKFIGTSTKSAKLDMEMLRKTLLALGMSLPLTSDNQLVDTTIDQMQSCVETHVIEMYRSNTNEKEIELVKINEIPDIKSQDYWDNFSQLQDNIVILPTRKRYSVHSNLEPQSIINTNKISMELYPSIARPSITSKFMEEFNSMTNRHGRAMMHQKHKLNLLDEYMLFKKNYFKDGWQSMLNDYKLNKVTFDLKASIEWCVKHNRPKEVLDDLIKLLNEGWEMNPINRFQVHGKTEQTTKLGKLSRWFDEVVTRSIVAGSYAVAALFSPMFMELKKRFKDALQQKVKYVDGMTPEQLSAFAGTFEPAKYIIEDDLTAQDAQTTMEEIGIECLIYRDLGIDEELLQFYIQCHEHWAWKGHGIKGFDNAMRLTGQVTTALGNAIVNLIVHNRFYRKNKNRIILVMLLGDDIIFLSNHLLDVKNHGTETKELYNMVSKVSQRMRVGGFLSMLVHTINDKVELCPHFRRCRHRFSVCNYSFSELERQEKIESRTLSYCFMLGNIKQNIEIAKELNSSVTIPNWYNVDAAIVANALYDDTDEFVVRNDIGALLSMMKERKAHINVGTIWSAKNFKPNSNST